MSLSISRLWAVTPVLCLVIGNDTNGRLFIELLQQLDMPSEGILQSNDRPTTVKTRVIGNNAQMLRVDEERDEDISTTERKQLVTRIENILSRKKIDVIIFEDYDKGVINKSLIESVVKKARYLGIPIAVDPKKRNFNHYKNVTLFKPNLKELREGMKLDLEKGKLPEIQQAVRKLCTEHHIEIALVTLSDLGVLVQDDKNDELISAHHRNIADVSGAGDTVISVAAMCLALNTSSTLLASLANLAGGMVCEQVGVVPIAKQQLLAEAQRLKIS